METETLKTIAVIVVTVVIIVFGLWWFSSPMKRRPCTPCSSSSSSSSNLSVAPVPPMSTTRAFRALKTTDTKKPKGGIVPYNVGKNQESYEVEPAEISGALICYYPFDSDAKDNSSNGNDAILTGSPTFIAEILEMP